MSLRLLPPSNRRHVFALLIAGSKRLVPSDRVRGVFGPFCHLGRARGRRKDNVNLSLTRSLARFRYNELFCQRAPSNLGRFILVLPRRRRSDFRAATKGRGTRVIALTRANGSIVLVIRSRGSVHRFVTHRLTRACRILRTRGKGMTLSLIHGGAIGLVVDSIVVPVVSNFRLYGRVGGSIGIDRVPFVLLATRRGLRSHLGKLGSKTSTCVRGPFSVRLLATRINGLLGDHGLLGGACLRGPFTPMTSLTISRISSVFLHGLGSCLRRRLDGRTLSIRVLTSAVKVDASDLCHGIGNLSNLSPGSFVHVTHLGGTVLLVRGKRGHVDRVTFRINFSSPTCFSAYFRGRCKGAPSRCVGRLGVRGWG